MKSQNLEVGNVFQMGPGERWLGVAAELGGGPRSTEQRREELRPVGGGRGAPRRHRLLALRSVGWGLVIPYSTLGCFMVWI